MRSIRIKKLTMQSFSRYGSFAQFVRPTGDKIGEKPVEFFRDMLQQSIGSVTKVSYSSCVVTRRPLIINCTEYHDHCYEMLVSLCGDCVIHAAPACPKGDVPYDDIEAFFVPQGTMVSFKAGVWHQAPFAYNCDVAYVLCALPERTYATDSTVLMIPKEQQILIEDIFE